MIGKVVERQGIIRAGADMVEAMATATVPKVTLTVGHASGAGYYAMAGQGFDPDGIPDPTRPDCIDRPAGRGLFLIRELVDDLAFNEQGNSICMTLHRA